MKTIEKQQATELRSQGFSYREIEAVLPVSRGSLSRWLRHLELTQEQQARIHRKNLSIRRQFIEYNQRRRAETLANKADALETAAQSVGALTERELHLVGTALYWAEGAKGRLTSVIEFVNADPAMITLMMRWFRVCCIVPEPKFRLRVQLHSPEGRQEAERFWAAQTGIPLQQFTQPILKPSPSSKCKQGNHLPYGTLHIRIADVRLLMRVQGWVKGLGLAPSSSPA